MVDVYAGVGGDRMNLRDHDQPCEHGEMLTHGYRGECPGGREITIIELGRWDTQDSLTFDWQSGINGSLIVALGVTE